MVDGIKQKPIEGVSMAYTFDKANADAPSTRKTQYFEMISNRGIYHDGWYANTTPPVAPWVLNAPMPDVNDYKWELYNLNEDYSQANDLAAKMPDKLKEMQALFDAGGDQVQRASAGQLARSRGRSRRGRARPPADRLHLLRRDARHSDRQCAEHPEQVVHDHRRGRGPAGRRRRDDRHRGRALGRVRAVPAQGQAGVQLQHAHARAVPLGTASRPLAAGKHTIVFDFTYDGPGIAKGGTGVLKVDGKEVARCRSRRRSRSCCRLTRPSTSGSTPAPA